MPFVRPHTSSEVFAAQEQHQNAAERGQLVAGMQQPLSDGMDMGPTAQPQRAPPKADLVMVFPYKTSALVRFGDAAAEEESRGLRAPLDKERQKMETWQAKRSTAFRALDDAGLVLCPFYSRDRDEVFVRLAADDNHLKQVAEMRRFRLELKPQFLSAFAEYKNDYVGRRELNYSDRCVVSHLYKAHANISNPGEYPLPGAIFRTVDRIDLVDYIIRQSDHNCAGVDLGQLMHDGDLLHYFPMHEPAKLREMDEQWFKVFAWGTDIDKVRDYFGERIAMYFLFMSHFNKWLVIPSIVGLVFFLVEMMAGTPDNFTSLFFCIGMGVWATFFVHFWRRTAAKAALKWGTLGMSKQLEPTRPEFRGVARINPVTGRVDRYYPWSSRIWKVLFSASVLAVTVIMLTFVILALFALRHIFHKAGGRIWFQILNAIVVEIFNTLFTRISKWLTDRENHRAYSEYQNHLLAKTVVFKFINCYISLYYIAFFKNNSQLFGMAMKCVNDDCLEDLGSQLAIFMIVKVTLQNFVELGLPQFFIWYRSFMEGRTFQTSMFTNPLTVMPDLSNAEKQSKRECYDVYEDMDEVLILYGYTTLFVVACPWVPFLALVSSLLECFLDQKKLVMLYRRPFPQRVSDNEPWDTAFDVFGMIAMTTNLAIFVFVSHSYDGWSHSHKIILFLAVEHLLIIGRILVGTLFPAIPTEVEVLKMQQGVMVHRHMNLGGEEDDADTLANAMMTSAGPPPHVFDNDQDEEED